MVFYLLQDRTHPQHKDFDLYVGEQLGKQPGKRAFKYETKEFKTRWEEQQRLNNPKTHRRPRFGQKLSCVVRKLDGHVGLIVETQDWSKVVGKKHRMESSGWAGWLGGVLGGIDGGSRSVGVIPGMVNVTTFKELTILAVDIAKIEVSAAQKHITLSLREGTAVPQQYKQLNVDRKSETARIKYGKLDAADTSPFGQAVGAQNP